MSIMKPYDHVPLSRLEDRFNAWKNILANHEVGNIYFLPHEDIHYRCYQFRDWCEARGFGVAIFDLEADLLHDEGKFKETLSEVTKPVVLIARSFFFANPDAARFLSMLVSARLANSLGYLIFHEGFPSLLASLLSELPPSLHQHELTYSFYDKDTMYRFLSAMAKDWSLQVTDTSLEEIWQTCGGNIWLATDTLRGLRDDPKESIQNHAASPLFSKKAGLFWDGIPESHKAVLVYGKTLLSDERIQKELLRFGFSFVSADQPLYLKKLIQDEKLNVFSLSDGHVYYKKTDISREFSNGERRVLFNLSHNEGVPVSRESLGESFWQDRKAEEFSDWALDKIMSRIRVKIERLCLPVVIATQRGKGYVYRRSG